eukprot:3260600-Pleurochrysis_carterae.AAC.1
MKGAFKGCSRKLLLSAHPFPNRCSGFRRGSGKVEHRGMVTAGQSWDGFVAALRQLCGSGCGSCRTLFRLRQKQRQRLLSSSDFSLSPAFASTVSQVLSLYRLDLVISREISGGKMIAILLSMHGELLSDRELCGTVRGRHTHREITRLRASLHNSKCCAGSNCCWRVDSARRVRDSSRLPLSE